MRTQSTTAPALAHAADAAELPADLLGTLLIFVSVFSGLLASPTMFALFPLALVLPVVVRLIGRAAQNAAASVPQALHPLSVA